MFVRAYLFAAGIVKDKSTAGKSYAVYSISVTETNLSTEAVRKWQTTRRYSDFYDLYVLICENVSKIIHWDHTRNVYINCGLFTDPKAKR